MLKKISVSSILRFAAVFLFLLFKYVEMWSFLITGEIYKSKIIIAMVAIIIAAISLKMKFDKRDIKKLLTTFIVFSVIVIFSKRFDLIVAFAFSVIYFNNEDGDKKFVKSFFISSAFLFITTIFLSIIGFLPSTFSTRLTESGNIINRNNLGFYGANSLFLSFYPIVISCIILYFKDNWKKNVLISLVVLILSIIFYKLTNCRAGILCIIVTLILANFMKFFRKNIFKQMAKYSFIILFIVSLVLALIFGTNTDNPISKISSGRMYFWNYYIKNVGFNFIGSEAIKTLPLDNLYLQFFYIYGFIAFALYFCFNVIANKKMVESNKLIFVIFAFSIYGFFENNIAFNLNFLITFMLIYVLGNKNNMFFTKEE